ncbi:MAG: tRNA (adenosine(37)-N6)-threonylcarbamoyltransferase complex dimerization subunit type 1 TsaB [Planctomycetota bacterium]|nr:MAG: tRNA (adenosine(37)-N6)-threonylcarbamoyltransferase complex dimerization subunit type 1 TsaB [Planctomycetota bacterium]
MIALAIETSSRRGGVALARAADACGGVELLACETIEEGMRHGEALMPAIERCLEQAGLGYGALDLVVAGTGPGSYTGVRVGLATARALAFAHGLEVLAVPSFDAIAAVCAPPAGGGEIVVLRNAYQGAIYRGRYAAERSAAGGARRRGAIELLRRERALEGIEPPALLVGDGLALLEPPALEGFERQPEHTDAPADALVRIGLARALAGERTPPAALLPLYLRPPLGGGR